MRPALIVLWMAVTTAALASETFYRMPRDLPTDDWYRVEIMSHHVGWMHLYSELAEFEGTKAIRVKSELVLKLLRSGTPLELNRTRTVYFAAAPPFAPIFFSMSSDESGSPRRVEGRVSNGSLRMTTYMDGRATDSTVPIPDDALFEEAMPFALHEFAPTDALTITLFNGDVLLPMS
ncbi:MAG: hypothetical protein O3A46_11720, partial [Candidatus Poribacteria bacterium]|nr:hypothetical protein [Candidatus Poribacteria bacterium]